ncbi:gliding motility protein GldL [Limibacter armeniacum]|uniref:type IX secretion system motor protein PorL/GldL n=1 Tax=Limibacter armeniacum TaxID=466084 RepID=UPI002FE68FDC
MSHHKETFNEKFNRVWVPKITAVGAAVVIVGALFKLQHWPGAGPMLIVGLGAEAFLFLLGAIAPTPPVDKHYNWENVYPQLLTDEVKAVETSSRSSNGGALVAIDKMIENANLTPETFKSFGSGMEKLNASVAQMRDLSNSAAASDEYTKSLQVATRSMGELNKSFSGTAEAMNAMAGASKDAKEYHMQVQAVSKNLGALNAVYEMELKDANNHLKAMNKFYGNLSSAMQNMSDASKESEHFKTQMSALTGNLSKLNNIYGKMLSAMKG